MLLHKPLSCCASYNSSIHITLFKLLARERRAREPKSFAVSGSYKLKKMLPGKKISNALMVFQTLDLQQPEDEIRK